MDRKRNWSDALALLKNSDDPGPWVVDLMASPSRGVVLQHAVCPCITKTRASALAYFLVRRHHAHFVKRRLVWRELCNLQGWPGGWNFGDLQRQAQDGDSKPLMEAIGNGMSFNVQEALWASLSRAILTEPL